MGLSFIYAGVAESEQAANLKFVGFIACGFESRLRYQKYFKGILCKWKIDWKECNAWRKEK